LLDSDALSQLGSPRECDLRISTWRLDLQQSAHLPAANPRRKAIRTLTLVALIPFFLQVVAIGPPALTLVSSLFVYLGQPYQTRSPSDFSNES
jgi:hypothetical protein